MHTPQISIALPVFNGENYLPAAIESVLAQTFEDFELIITDNASTDGTAEICKRYASDDPRISYRRNAQNIGPNQNFKLGLSLARGQFFKWAAHDDLLAPSLLAKCVALLRNDPQAVLVQSLVGIIDETGSQIATYNSGLANASDLNPAVRLRPLVLHRPLCTDIFGVFRTEVLRQTPGLSNNYFGSDRSLLAEIAVLGKIEQVPEVLFFHRHHSRRYSAAVKPSERVSENRSDGGRKVELSHWLIFKDFKRAVDEHVHDPAQKRQCYRVLAGWWLVDANALRVLIEVVSQVIPQVYDWSKWFNDRFFKPALPKQGKEGR